MNRLYNMKFYLLIVSLILIKTNLLFGQKPASDYIKIDKNDLFLKGKLFGNIKTVKVNSYFFDDNLKKKISRISIFKFNAKKELIEIEYINTEDKRKEIFHYLYDNKHNIIKEYSDNFKDTTYNYYDTNSNKIQTTYYNYGTSQTIFKYKYDTCGRIIEEWRLGAFLKYKYSGRNKNYVLCEIFDKDDKTLLESTSCNYDIDGNCINKTTTIYKPNERTVTVQEMKYENSRLIYIKNPHGESHISYDNLGAIIKKTNTDGVYEYKILYDKFNNEKTVTTLKNNSKIEYYEYFYEYF